MPAPAPNKPPKPLIASLIIGLMMVIGPFIWTMVSVSRASNVQGGLREVTKIRGREDDVGMALGSASLSALLIPPGILITVLSGLALAKRRRSTGQHPRGQHPHD